MRTVVALLAALTLAACSSDRSEVVTVSVASSLTEAFEAVERQFESSQHAIGIDINSAGSTTIVNQVIEGAPVQVVVTADRVAIEPLEGLLSETATLASNRLTVLRSTSAPAIAEPSDLLEDDLIVSACDPALPCGRLTVAVLAALDLPVEIDSFESNVRLVRERVASGEADVGFVYVTDLSSTVDDLRVIEAAVLDGVALRNDVVVGLVDDGDAARVVHDYIVANAPEVLSTFGFEVR